MRTWPSQKLRRGERRDHLRSNWGKEILGGKELRKGRGWVAATRFSIGGGPAYPDKKIESAGATKRREKGALNKQKGGERRPCISQEEKKTVEFLLIFVKKKGGANV